MENNHIQNFFANKEGNKEVLIAKELFEAKDTDVDIKTELEFDELQLINSMMWNNALMESKGLKRHYHNYIWYYMRLKISYKRKSRGEFVEVNRNKIDNINGGLVGAKGLADDKK